MKRSKSISNFKYHGYGRIPALLLIVLLQLSFCVLKAQPQGINYQAVARDVSGSLIMSQNIAARFTIYNDSANGALLYRETRMVTTNAFGLFTHVIGRGTPVQGSFTSINWKHGDKYLEIAVDPAGGSNFTTLGASELLSVPYALSAPDEQTLQWSDATKTLSISGGNSVILPISGGSVGPTGPAGAPGQQGPQGVAGPAGLQGVTGAAGLTGPQGAQGATGVAGPTGAQGLPGAVGPTGATGQAGDRYTTSSTTGLTIATGTKNLTVGIGLAYAVGQTVIVANSALNQMTGVVTGYNSGTGAMTINVNAITGSGTFSSWSVALNGAPGPAGNAGATGITGPTGAQGPQGAPGQQGTQGPAGNAGATGVTGPTGAQGPQGVPGQQGTQGIAGNAGATGVTGPTGAQGPQGAPGQQGIQGPVGATGTVSDLNGDVTGAPATNTVTRIQGRDVANAAPIAGNILKWNGTAWAPGTDSSNIWAREKGLISPVNSFDSLMIGGGVHYNLAKFQVYHYDANGGMAAYINKVGKNGYGLLSEVTDSSTPTGLRVGIAASEHSGGGNSGSQSGNYFNLQTGSYALDATAGRGIAVGAFALQGTGVFTRSQSGYAIFSEGKLRFRNIGEASGRVLTCDTAGNATWQPVSGTLSGGQANYVPLWTGSNSQGVSKIYQEPGTGRIGIGTRTIPSLYQLQLNDSVYSIVGLNLSNAISGNSSGDGLALLTDGVDAYLTNLENGDLSIATNGKNVSNAFIRLKPSGNLGIGFSNPFYKLDVNGNGRFAYASSLYDPQLTLQEYTPGNYARLTFKTAASNGFWSVAGLTTNAASGDKLNFYHSSGGDVLSISGDKKVNVNGEFGITDGFLKVAGTTKTAFQITSAVGNTSLNQTTLSYAGAQSTDIVMVTPLWNGTYLNAPIGVYFSSGNWYVFRQDMGTMPNGVTFNVMVIKQ